MSSCPGRDPAQWARPRRTGRARVTGRPAGHVDRSAPDWWWTRILHVSPAPRMPDPRRPGADPAGVAGSARATPTTAADDGHVGDEMLVTGTLTRERLRESGPARELAVDLPVSAGAYDGLVVFGRPALTSDEPRLTRLLHEVRRSNPRARVLVAVPDQAADTAGVPTLLMTELASGRSIGSLVRPAVCEWTWPLHRWHGVTRSATRRSWQPCQPTSALAACWS